MQLRELLLKVMNAALALLRAIGEISGGDSLVCRDVRALGAGDNGNVIGGGEDFLVAHDEARRVAARARLVFDGRGRGQGLCERRGDIVAEIGDDGGEENPENKIGIVLALLHGGSFPSGRRYAS